MPKPTPTPPAILRNYQILLPLWIPFLLITIPIAFLWWRDRRIPLGHCQRCRYDLTGNTSGVCPECGTQAKPLPAEGAAA